MDQLSEVNDKLAESKAKYVDLSSGGYVDKAKHAALKTQFDGLAEQVKQFDGVDIEALKTSASTWEQKYNDDISKLKLDYAVNSALQGARNVKAVKSLIDMSIVKLDGDGVVGLAEQVEKLRESDPYLFEQTETKPQKKGGFAQGTPNNEDAELAKWLKAAGVRK